MSDATRDLPAAPARAPPAPLISPEHKAGLAILPILSVFTGLILPMGQSAENIAAGVSPWMTRKFVITRSLGAGALIWAGVGYVMHLERKEHQEYVEEQVRMRTGVKGGFV